MSLRLSWLILILVAVALRLPDIGHPLIDVDEQMYLLVGQRMWQGAIPYVDIWDRKPVGLFLIAALSQRLPIDPIVAYHLLAGVAATATAGVVTILARRVATPVGALAAGIVYLVWIALLGGRGGQSPIFYDLAIAGAALATWDHISGRRRTGWLAMLLVGIALQIKPTVVFEGWFFGIALLYAQWRYRPGSGRLVARAAVYVTLAFGPTIAAAAVYAAMGHGDAWWFANVVSIFLRRTNPGDPTLARMAGVAVILLVPMGLAVRGLMLQRGEARIFFGGWLAVAIIGWLAVPPYFNHYALPLLVPIAVAAARAMERPALCALALLAGGALLLFSGYPHGGETADARRHVDGLARRINRERGEGCLFVFQAPPGLYSATGSCLPTRYPFPYHLVEASEAGAIGVDPLGEVAHILQQRPPVIVAGDIARNRQRPAVILMRRVLAHHYRAVARDDAMVIYRRID